LTMKSVYFIALLTLIYSAALETVVHGLEAKDIRFSFVSQFDSRLPIASLQQGEEDAEEQAERFLIRRLRPIVAVQLNKSTSLYSMVDFGNGRTVMQDAYLNLNLSENYEIKIGKFKSPVSMDRFQSSNSLFFIERGHSSQLAPNRDIGIQISNTWNAGQNQWGLGVFNGARDNSTTSDTENDSNKEIQGRIFLQTSPNLGIGAGGSYGNKTGSENLSRFRSITQNNIFRYARSTTAQGHHHRISPQLYFQNGPMGLFYEGNSSTQIFKNSLGYTHALNHHSTQIIFHYVLTGESATFFNIRPKKPFNFEKNHWGAFELVFRYTDLVLDDDTFNYGFASQDKSISKAESLGVGLNWYLDNQTGIMFNLENSHYKKGAVNGDLPSETTLFTRLQYTI